MSAAHHPARPAGRVGVLGAGIMGSCLALQLARRGFAVTLFDREREPMAAASRWNEGKIHLGYLYGADPSLETPRRVLPGGLVFGRLIAELISSDLAPHVTPQDDIYLVHRRSVVDADQLAASFAAISALIRDHADASGYLSDASAARASRLSPACVAALADPEDIVAGFVTPERSVNSQWVADGLVAALRSEPRIALRMGVEITGALPVASPEGAWRVRVGPGPDERFDTVVNALWQGRLAVDLAAGLPPDAVWSNRYRLSIFAGTAAEVTVPSAVVSVGPFGDVKNYNGRDFYLSWYPAGLNAESAAVTPELPPQLSAAARARLIAAVRAGLTAVMPRTAEIFDGAESLTVAGGWVFAQGQGSLADPASSLHRRDRFGVRRRGRYLSVDTGKFSTAPWLALNLANEIAGT